MRFPAAAGLVMILFGLAAYYATDELSAFSIANLVLGPLLLIATAVWQSRRVQGFRGTRSRRVLLRWTAIVLGVAVVAILLNGLAARLELRLDLTSGQQYTLSEQSLALCEGFRRDPPREALSFVMLEDALLADDVRLLAEAYEASCPVVLEKRRLVDASSAARRVLRTHDTSIVACLGERCEAVGFPSESNMTNALLRLVRTRSPHVYFLVGHGEGDAASIQPDGYSGLIGSLRDEGIAVDAWVSLAAHEVPEDAALLVALAPERDLLEAELAGIDRYLSRGGRLLAFVEPGIDSNLHGLLERWGFGLPAGILADPRGSPLLEESSLTALIASAYDSYHPVTRKLGPRNMVLLPTARPVLAVRKPEPQDRVEPLLFSGPLVWLEEDVEAARRGRLSAPPAGGQQRALPLAAAGRYPREHGEARIVVIGDRDLGTNRLLGALYDRDLILFAILWLAEDEASIALRPKWWRVDDDPLTIQQTLAYFYFMAFILPELLLLLGIHAWYRQQ